MSRNIDTRVEVGFPIYDEQLKTEIKEIIKIQLEDNTKARDSSYTKDFSIVKSAKRF